MPSIRDFSEEDENGQLGGRGGGIGGGGSGQSSAQPQAQREETFTPWSRFVSANADVSQREAGRLASGVQGEADAAIKTRDDAGAAQSSAISQNYLGGGRSSKPSTAFGDTAARSAQQPGSSFSSSGGSFGAPAPQADTISSRPTSAGQPLSMMTRPSTPSMSPITGKPVAGAAQADEAPAPYINPDRLSTDLSGGFPKTTGDGITGAKDLKSQLGADAWTKLVGDTMGAQHDATSLGSTPGVEALLQKQGGAPNTAFDAALIGGAGGKQFRDLAQQYGGDTLSKGLLGAEESAQGRWQKLMDDVEAAGSSRDKSITDANAEMGRLAAEQAAKGLPPEVKQKAAESKSWLEEHFPVPQEFQSQDGFAQWVYDNRNGEAGANAQQGGYSNLKAWADQIYGDASQKGIDQLYADIRRMTPEEYQAFMYGMVPEWMGNGSKAAGFNGGKFYGLGNTGDRYTLETTGKATAENQKFWSEWRAAMETFYQVLAAVATAAATATGGPVAGAAVSAGLQAALAGEKAASNGGKQLGEEDED